MQKRILQDETKKDRLEMLKTNAERSEEFTYPKHLNKEEMTAVKNEVVKGNIEMAKLKEEKQHFMDTWKEKKKPVEKKLNEDLSVARTHVEEVTEVVYLMADQEEGIMEYYNADGVCVFMRPLQVDERQFRIVDKTSEGTNDY